MSEPNETVIAEIKKVPTKYWVIGGVALLLLFLYIRKRGILASQTSAESDNLTSAMTIPGGISYAPISSGVTGGTGQNQSDISSTFGNNAMTVDTATNTTTQTPASTYYAPSTYQNNWSNNPTPSDGLNITADVNIRGGTGVFLPNGNEIMVSDVGDYVRNHPLDSAQSMTELYNYGHSIGLNNVDISNLRSYAREDFGVNPNYGYGATLTGSIAMPAGLSAGVIPVSAAPVQAAPVQAAPAPIPATPLPVAPIPDYLQSREWLQARLLTANGQYAGGGMGGDAGSPPSSDGGGSADGGAGVSVGSAGTSAGMAGDTAW